MSIRANALSNAIPLSEIPTDRRRIREALLADRTCRVCGDVRPLSEFGSNGDRGKWWSRKHACRACDAKRRAMPAKRTADYATFMAAELKAEAKRRGWELGWDVSPEAERYLMTIRQKFIKAGGAKPKPMVPGSRGTDLPTFVREYALHCDA